MYNPKDVFTDNGLEEHTVHVFNMKQAISWLVNHADDLHINALSRRHLNTIYEMKHLLDSKVLENGDGERYES
jgi:hypothetical protein